MTVRQQNRTLEHFVAGTMLYAAAGLIGVHLATAIKSYHLLAN